jgi:AcrR family transcriptional regulator
MRFRKRHVFQNTLVVIDVNDILENSHVPIVNASKHGIGLRRKRLRNAAGHNLETCYFPKTALVLLERENGVSDLMQEICAEKRGRGRPQVRCDDDTKAIIIQAANDQFKKAGYALASISTIAQTAGISTKTLYRLFPAKADLFSELISAKIGQYFLGLDENSLRDMGVREGLERLLLAYGRLTLSTDTIAITRLVLSESDRFPEIARVFYEQAITRTSVAMEKWLSLQSERGLITLQDPAMATGMLRGMMVMEPQRAVMLGQLSGVSDERIVERSRICASLFLNGCMTVPMNMGG